MKAGQTFASIAFKSLSDELQVCILFRQMFPALVLKVQSMRHSRPHSVWQDLRHACGSNGRPSVQPEHHIVVEWF